MNRSLTYSKDAEKLLKAEIVRLDDEIDDILEFNRGLQNKYRERSKGLQDIVTNIRARGLAIPFLYLFITKCFL